VVAGYHRCLFLRAHNVLDRSMRRPSYRHYLHLIQEQIKRNLIYSFAWLATSSPSDMLEKVWTIDRKTLERARNSGELICCGPTRVQGAWFLAWASATENERRGFANRKIYGRYWPPTKRSRHGVDKKRIGAGHANA